MRSLTALLLLLCLASPLEGAEVVPWLYEVAVPVEDQSAAERERATGEALRLLLHRLTGLTELPDVPELSEALNTANRYFNEYRYARTDAGGLELVVQFDQTPVLMLIRKAGLPIWRASRERVMVWAVLASAGERRILSAADDSPLVAGLLEAARRRGLPVILPLLDLEDQLLVEPAAVWGRLSLVLEPASARYNADLILTGRITGSDETGWTSDWEFWVDGSLIPVVLTGADLGEQGRQVIDRVADELAARRSVHTGEAGQVAITVAGIASPADYRALLGYLESLEFVDRVSIAGIRERRLWLFLDTPADAEALLSTFRRDGRLDEEPLAFVPATDLNLIWQSRD